MYNIRIVAGQILHNPNGRKKGESGSLLALSQSIENHGKSMKIISNQNLLQSIKQAGVQNSPKWDLGDLRSLDTWNLQKLIIDLRLDQLNCACGWWSLCWLASPSPANIIPNTRAWNFWNLKSLGFFRVLRYVSWIQQFHPNPPRNPGTPKDLGADSDPVLRRTVGAPCGRKGQHYNIVQTTKQIQTASICSYLFILFAFLSSCWSSCHRSLTANMAETNT